MFITISGTTVFALVNDPSSAQRRFTHLNARKLARLCLAALTAGLAGGGFLMFVSAFIAGLTLLATIGLVALALSLIAAWIASRLGHTIEKSEHELKEILQGNRRSDYVIANNFSSRVLFSDTVRTKLLNNRTFGHEVVVFLSKIAVITDDKLILQNDNFPNILSEARAYIAKEKLLQTIDDFVRQHDALDEDWMSAHRETLNKEFAIWTLVGDMIKRQEWLSPAKT
jgi:hypothetical protein